MSAKHWRSMTMQDQNLKECFAQPPLIAYRRQANLRNFLIKSKLPPPPERYPRRDLKGTKRCGKACTACPFIEGKQVKINQEETWMINKHLICESFDIIYMLECKKCYQRYIGTSGRKFKFRLADHGGYITNQVVSRATGAHFNQPGYSLADCR